MPWNQRWWGGVIVSLNKLLFRDFKLFKEMLSQLTKCSWMHEGTKKSDWSKKSRCDNTSWQVFGEKNNNFCSLIPNSYCTENLITTCTHVHVLIHVLIKLVHTVQLNYESKGKIKIICSEIKYWTNLCKYLRSVQIFFWNKLLFISV